MINMITISEETGIGYNVTIPFFKAAEVMPSVGFADFDEGNYLLLIEQQSEETRDWWARTSAKRCITSGKIVREDNNWRFEYPEAEQGFKVVAWAKRY